MNNDEKIAEKYLKRFGQVVYEPDGNMPPDFVIAENIGVEVRRLNQNYMHKGKVIGLEQNSIPLFQAIEETLKNYSVTDKDQRFWLSLRHSHNDLSKKNLIESLENAIDKFESSGYIVPSTYQLSNSLEIVFGAKAANTNKKYSLGIITDHNNGGCF